MKNIFSKISDTGLHSFKVYQALGWSIYYFSELMLSYSTSKLTLMGFIAITLRILFGVGLTFIIRLYYRKIAFRSVSIFRILLTAFIVSLISAILNYFITPVIYFILQMKFSLWYYSNISSIVRGISYYLPIYAGWSILYFSIKFWLEWENQKKIAEKASAMFQNTQFQLLRYHLNPHFLFNALNSIRALIDEDSASSRNLITELSEYLRYSLVSRNKPSVSLKEEIEAVKHYLSVEKQRYEEKLEVSFDIDPKSGIIQIPSFIIQPLIENAIKFGMKTSTMPLKIIIKTEVSGSLINISVINSGKWVDDKFKSKESFDVRIKKCSGKNEKYVQREFQNRNL